jgi:hypothetical protein
MIGIMKKIIPSLMTASLIMSAAFTVYAESDCDAVPSYAEWRMQTLQRYSLASNYVRSHYSDAEINAEILRRFRASLGNVERDKNIRLLLGLDGYRNVSQNVIDSGRAQFIVPASNGKDQISLPASEGAIVAVIEITDIKERFLAAYAAYQAALNLPPDRPQEAVETHYQTYNNITHKMDSDINVREESSTKIKEISREEKIAACFAVMQKLGERWLCLAYTTGLPDRIAEANESTKGLEEMATAYLAR